MAVKLVVLCSYRIENVGVLIADNPVESALGDAVRRWEHQPGVLGGNTLRKSLQATKPTKAEWYYIVVL